jgi:hypothetical protein
VLALKGRRTKGGELAESDGRSSLLLRYEGSSSSIQTEACERPSAFLIVCVRVEPKKTKIKTTVDMQAHWNGTAQFSSVKRTSVCLYFYYLSVCLSACPCLPIYIFALQGKAMHIKAYPRKANKIEHV